MVNVATKPSLSIFLFAILANAQNGPSSVFEVASVKPSVISGNGVFIVARHLQYGADRLEALNYSLRALIAEAYQIPVEYVTSKESGANGLLDRAYQVAAKAAAPTPKEEIRAMLRNLLIERFRLTLHQESKLQLIYRLAVQKQGTHLQRSAAEKENARWVRGPEGLFLRDATIEQFCKKLSTYMDRPVLDSTGISGLYNFPFLPGTSRSEEGQSVVISQVQQLGLQLVSGKAAIEYLVVDHVEKGSAN